MTVSPPKGICVISSFSQDDPIFVDEDDFLKLLFVYFTRHNDKRRRGEKLHRRGMQWRNGLAAYTEENDGYFNTVHMNSFSLNVITECQ